MVTTIEYSPFIPFILALFEDHELANGLKTSKCVMKGYILWALQSDATQGCEKHVVNVEWIILSILYKYST